MNKKQEHDLILHTISLEGVEGQEEIYYNLFAKEERLSDFYMAQFFFHVGRRDISLCIEFIKKAVQNEYSTRKKYQYLLLLIDLLIQNERYSEAQKFLDTVDINVLKDDVSQHLSCLENECCLSLYKRMYRKSLKCCNEILTLLMPYNYILHNSTAGYRCLIETYKRTRDANLRKHLLLIVKNLKSITPEEIGIPAILHEEIIRRFEIALIE